MELHTGLSPCLAIEASFQTTCQILLHSSPAASAGVGRAPQQWTLCIQETDSAICESRPQSEEKSSTVRKERNARDPGPRDREQGLPLSGPGPHAPSPLLSSSTLLVWLHAVFRYRHRFDQFTRRY